MLKKLTNLGIKNAPDGKHEDGGGLRLVKKGNAGKWVYRYSRLGKRREMGIGTYPALSLADARRERDKWAQILNQGSDPIQVRNTAIEAERAERDHKDPTFIELAHLVFEARKASLRGDGTRGRWLSPITLYVFPAFGKKHLSEIHQDDIYKALKSIWRSKYPTAEKALQRTRIILRSGKKMGYSVDPEMVDGAQEMLGIVDHKVTHVPSTPWRNIPVLYAKLGDTTSGRCLKWMILTMVRSDGCRGAKVQEIDFEQCIWTVPASRIKGLRGAVTDFRVPLVPPLMKQAIICRDSGMEYLFPSRDGTKGITDVAVEKALKATNIFGTPHGLRTSFRTWVQDTEACSYEVAETVLGHRIGGIVERSYARSDLLDRRRQVMTIWSDYVVNSTSPIE